MATKRVGPLWACGGHGMQVLHAAAMQKLEQETDQVVLAANAAALGQEDPRGKPVLLG